MEFFDKVKAPTLGVLDVDDDTGIKRQVAEKKNHSNNRIIKDHSPYYEKSFSYLILYIRTSFKKY